MTGAKTRLSVFSGDGLSVLRSFISGTTLFSFDLDGTLAPIVPDPGMIVIADEVRDRMKLLCSLAPVAVLTGRSCDDARGRLGFEPRFIVGNHGAEGVPGWEKREPEFVRLCLDWEGQLQGLLPRASDNGIVIENKGASLSLHYRNSPKAGAALSGIMLAVKQLKPRPRRVSGKYVENILPEHSLNKGEALLQIMRNAGATRAVFVGDDDTDEDVFRMRNSRILGIRVGDGSQSQASYVLPHQGNIDLLLGEIINRLGL
jgi:trehalose 6-phosphate phosphatase